MAKLYLARGPVAAAIGLIVVVIGANLFDSTYESVEPILLTKSLLISNKEILPNQFLNSTISTDQLKEHNVLIVHTNPTSGSVKLDGLEPNGMTFEKESNNGFLYHIIEKTTQGGDYSIKISNLGSSSVRVDIVLGEDPFLSKNCGTAYGTKCSMVWIAIGFVIIGIISFIIGILIGIFDLRKERKLQK